MLHRWLVPLSLLLPLAACSTLDSDPDPRTLRDGRLAALGEARP